MGALLASGQLIDGILLLIGAEVILLAWWQGRHQRRLSRGFIANLGSGAVLMLGIRFALTDAPWPWIAACLGASLLCHLVDLRERLQRAG